MADYLIIGAPDYEGPSIKEIEADSPAQAVEETMRADVYGFDVSDSPLTVYEIASKSEFEIYNKAQFRPTKPTTGGGNG